MSNVCHCASICPRETMIQWKPEFSTSKWTLPLLPSNSASRKLRLFGRKWHVSENLCAHYRKEALWSIHKMTPACTTPALASDCHHQRRCWVRPTSWIHIYRLTCTNLAHWFDQAQGQWNYIYSFVIGLSFGRTLCCLALILSIRSRLAVWSIGRIPYGLTSLLAYRVRPMLIMQKHA